MAVDSKTCKIATMDEFRASLKKFGLKATPQRLLVHEAMTELGHASADMIAEKISEKEESKVTVASVYNILAQLSLLGLYRHRLSSNNKMYFDVNAFDHAHLYDTENNSYKDIMDDELMAMLESYVSKRKFRGYKIDGFDLQILCHPSKSKKVPTNR